MLESNKNSHFKSNKSNVKRSNNDRVKELYNSDCFSVDIDNWDLINGFDLFETERSNSDNVNSSDSLEKWLLCGSWTMPFPSHRVDNSIHHQSNHETNTETNIEYSEESDIPSNHLYQNMKFEESSPSSYTESDCTINSEVYNMNSYDKLKTTKLFYSNEDSKINNTKKANSVFLEPKNYIPNAIDENDLASLKELDKKIESALDRVNYMQNETRNLIYSVSNSLPSLDELMSTSSSLKTNTGKFKKTCKRIMWSAHFDCYKCILFIAFGVGVALWTL